jgi:hypothetical protein
MARSFPFDYAFGFAQGKLFRCASLKMTLRRRRGGDG